MSSENIQNLIVMVIYIALMIGIGVYYSKRANENSQNYFLGGRKLGPWVTAMSAEASDMSGWLLMGLPGVAYWMGISDAFWTALGLAIGTYINWKVVSKPLRNYSHEAGNAITIPEYFSNRFNENKKVLLFISSVFILIFFSVYAASCFVTCGKLFNQVFGFNYQAGMIVGALIIVTYTLLGGFLAVTFTDFIQALIMVCAIVLTLVFGLAYAGGPSAVLNNLSEIPGFMDFFGMATPTVDAEGVQQLGSSGEPLFGAAGTYGLITIVSTMAWGLGYFGMPQVLVRFMAIEKVDELNRSRQIAVTWVIISLTASVAIGLMGRYLFPTDFLTASSAENIFVLTSQVLFHPLVAGVIMAGILAATMSSSDSYLLVVSSAVANDLYKGIFKKNATDKSIMFVSKIALIIVLIAGIIIAWDENSVIFTIVSFAWAGFGAAFGPLVLFSLFWKRCNRAGAIAGILTGGIMVFVWKLLIRPLGGIVDIYELLPAFILSCIAIVVVSCLTKEPNNEILNVFDKVKALNKGEK